MARMPSSYYVCDTVWHVAYFLLMPVSITFVVNRVTTCLENLDMSGNLTAVREMSGILLKVKEMSGKKSCQGNVA